jgi:hypothetical protein
VSFHLSPESWTAAGTVANVVIVLALTIITFLYMRSAKRQADAAKSQVEQSQRQADAAMESLTLLKAQVDQTKMRELLMAMAAFRHIKYEATFWKPFVTDQWGMMPDKVPQLLPLDWPSVFQLVSQISPELREEAQALEQKLGNAEYQIKLFQSKPQNYRDATVLPIARGNLENLTSHLNNLVNALEAHERQIRQRQR